MDGDIQSNAARLRALHEDVHRTRGLRLRSPQDFAAWKQAGERFRSEYDGLAFPGGYSRGLERIRNGDLATIARAIDYLEHTPYCFGSQYVATGLRRALNKVVLPESLADRLLRWKEAKTLKSRTRR
jgi:hypothetical protein